MNLKLRYKIIIFLSSFLICVSLLISAVGAGTGTNIPEEIKQFPGFSGILIKDLNTQEILFSHNEDKLFTPASLTKIFTLLTALEIFDEFNYIELKSLEVWQGENLIAQKQIDFFTETPVLLMKE